MSKKHSFLSRISKTMFPGSICRKTTIEKDGHFLAKNHGIHLLKNILFLYFFKVHYCLKSILLYPEYQINDVSLLDMPKTRHSKKRPFLAKNYRLTPLENFDFLEFFFLKIGFSRLNRIFFYLGHQKRCFLIGFAQKLQIRKITVFGQKPWTNPFGKFRFFGLF